MKTTKKGFTLIELIVVIAIIGVLAAILVPTMLGYVKKSKISSANSSAASVYKAINSALTELDEEGIDVGGDYLLIYTPGASGAVGTWSTGAAITTTTSSGPAIDLAKFTTKVSNFFADIDKVRKGVKAAVSGGACIACATANDSTYTGTYPAGVITGETYSSYKATANIVGDPALQAAIAQAGYGLNSTSGGYERVSSSATPTP